MSGTYYNYCAEIALASVEYINLRLVHNITELSWAEKEENFIESQNHFKWDLIKQMLENWSKAAFYVASFFQLWVKKKIAPLKTI